MDLGSPIGMVVCIAAIIVGVLLLGGTPDIILDAPSFMLVIIPTIGALFVSFPAKQVLTMGKHFNLILGRQSFDPLHYVNIMSELAEKARSQGLLALESEAGNMDDHFVKSAVLMVADAVDPETVEARLYGVIDAMTTRHNAAWALYDRGAAYAPAFGMCATVVALVNMLLNLNFEEAGGVALLGVSMSAALITTLYGSVMANIFFLPFKAKLQFLHQKEVDCKNIVIEGVLAIQRGTNPKVVREMLLERLDPSVAIAMGEN